MSCDIEGILMLTAKLMLIQNPFKNVLRIYKFKKNVSFATIAMKCSGLRNSALRV